jgi:Ca2+-binding RTX toxin-like protein
MLWRSSRAPHARTLLVLGAVLALGIGHLSTAGAQTSPVSATFSPAAGVLTIMGSATANSIVVGIDATGQILVNNGQVPILGGSPSTSTTSRLVIFGFAGDDEITLADFNATFPLPEATIFGGSGNDTITGGRANDRLFGEDGDDTLRGNPGADEMYGGPGNDILFGGQGNDLLFGEGGADRSIWNPGDASDLNEGGDGSDTLEFNASNASDIITVSANGTRVKVERNIGASTQDLGTTEALIVNGFGANDTIAATDGLAGLIKLTFNGGPGDDTLLGSDGADVLNGGEDNDTIMGNGGNDSAFMGPGDDVFIWEPADGNDIVEGEAGRDTMRFVGSNEDEKIDISARTNTRVRFFRDLGNITMDLDDVEVVEFQAQGGADAVVVKDLTITDTVEVVVNLERQPGAGDSFVDSVTVHGTGLADTVQVGGQNGHYSVTGLHAAVNVVGSEGHDQLLLNTLGGDDTIGGAILVGDVVKLIVDGGPGNDMIRGGRGADILEGGTGDDVFIWEPGDSSDVIDGQGGLDTLRFNGSNVAETIQISANGTRATFFRDIANITMDLDTIEEVIFNARGGTDTIVVNDLAGTDVRQVRLNLESIDGSGIGDAQTDLVFVNGTPVNDALRIDSLGGIHVSGLTAAVTIIGAEAANDDLTVAGQAGDDRLDASALAVGSVRLLTLDGGEGTDRLIGSPALDLALNGEVLIDIP